jgi:hypothetical protein
MLLHCLWRYYTNDSICGSIPGTNYEVWLGGSEGAWLLAIDIFGYWFPGSNHMVHAYWRKTYPTKVDCMNFNEEEIPYAGSGGWSCDQGDPLLLTTL